MLSTSPAEMAVTPLSPATAIGVLLQASPPQSSGPVFVPSPSCPSTLRPQAMTVPLLSRARPWPPPAEIAVTPLSPPIANGTSLFVVVPLPNEP